jgi:hypothetical protein
MRVDIHFAEFQFKNAVNSDSVKGRVRFEFEVMFGSEALTSSQPSSTIVLSSVYSIILLFSSSKVHVSIKWVVFFRVVIFRVRSQGRGNGPAMCRQRGKFPLV